MSACDDVDDWGRPGAEPRFASAAPLYPGCPALYVQTGGTEKEVAGAAELARHEGMGLVVTLGVKDVFARLVEVAKWHRAWAHTNSHLLVDANRYSGVNRRIGTWQLDPGWIEAQRAAGCPIALTDSPYLPRGDYAALDSVLSQTKRLGDDIVAVLPLHIDWLGKDVDQLIASVNASGVPVGLVLEHREDPFGLQRVVEGFVRFITQVNVRVVVLRCDLSAVGAIAWGASAGAVGTRTGLRHLYPIDKAGGGRPAQIGVYVPWSMAYRSLRILGLAMSADPDHQERWTCMCHTCYARTLDWITTDVSAYQHSVAAVGQLAERILARGVAPHERRDAWAYACGHALVMNDEIDGELAMAWHAPRYLMAWRKADLSLATSGPAHPG